MKEYNVLFKFGDVCIVVEAENEEEARKIAQTRLENDNLKDDSRCYDIEVEAQKIKKEYACGNIKTNIFICDHTPRMYGLLSNVFLFIKRDAEKLLKAIQHFDKNMKVVHTSEMIKGKNSFSESNTDIDEFIKEVLK